MQKAIFGINILKSDASASSPTIENVDVSDWAIADILQSKDGWHEVRVVRTGFTGWLPEHFFRDLSDIPETDPPLKEIPQIEFVQNCFRAARTADVNGAALVAIAWAESKQAWKDQIIGPLVNSESGAVGPFQFRQKTWDHLVGANPGEGLVAEDIENLRRQDIVAAIVAANAWKKIEDEGHPNQPTTLYLYLSHLFGSENALQLIASDKILTTDAVIADLYADGPESPDDVMNWYKELRSANGNPRKMSEYIADCTNRLQEGLDKAEEIFQKTDDFREFEEVLRKLVATPIPTPGNGALSLGKNEIYRAFILEAAERAGIDPAALAALIDAEAGLKNGIWNKDAQNDKSSASGLTQFLESTWTGQATKSGTNLNTVAKNKNFVTGANKLVPGKREALLNLRFDPRISIIAAADLAKANLNLLKSKNLITVANFTHLTNSPLKITSIGDDQRARFMYLGHLLGAQGAENYLMKKIENDRAAKLLSAQVGKASAKKRIESADGIAVKAFTAWLKEFFDKKIRPGKFRSKTPTPDAGDSGSQSLTPYAKKLAKVANDQFQKFHGVDEDVAPLEAKIKKYWQQTGFTASKQAWSAVFVSWCVMKAGATKLEFKFHPRHSVFVFWAIRNAIKGKGLFRAFPINEYAPKIGDIIHNNRIKEVNKRITYAIAQNKDAYDSHSAIVVNLKQDASGNRYAETIGGNEGDTVGKKTVPLDHNGFIMQKDKKYISIIQIRK